MLCVDPVFTEAADLRDLTEFFVPPQHPFVSQPLSRTLAIELLDKVSNPDQMSFQDHLDHLDDDETDAEVRG